MKQTLAFLKKEWTEHLRNGRILIHLILFLALGIMNVAIAKLTPLLLELFSDSMKESGMTITIGQVKALDAWIQFFKNAPIGLIAVHLLEGNLFVKEISDGTMLLAVTKGLSRLRIFISKAFFLFTLWTIEYSLYFGVTYGYCYYYWEPPFAAQLGFSVFLWYVFGLLTLGIAVLCSSFASSNTAVFGGLGSFILIITVLSLIPDLKTYSPTMLMNTTPLIYQSATPFDYWVSLFVSSLLFLLSVTIAAIQWNRKQL